MGFVLTIVAPDAGGLSYELLCDIAAEIDGRPDWSWLADGQAAALTVASDCGPAVSAFIAARSLALDMFILPEADQRKELLLADMDSTIVQGETLDELAVHAGLKDEIAAITQQAMAGDIDFETALRARVAKLKNLPLQAIAETLAEVQIMPGAKTLVQTMKAHGARTVLITGGFCRFAEAIAMDIGFDAQISNQLEIENGKLTGDILPPVIDQKEKQQTLVSQADALGLSAAQTLAVGDGANDLLMLGATDLGVAFHAKPVVNAQARHHIRFCDLTALLYAQGYAQADFI